MRKATYKLIAFLLLTRMINSYCQNLGGMPLFYYSDYLPTEEMLTTYNIRQVNMSLNQFENSGQDTLIHGTIYYYELYFNASGKTDSLFSLSSDKNHGRLVLSKSINRYSKENQLIGEDHHTYYSYFEYDGNISNGQWIPCNQIILKNYTYGYDSLFDLNFEQQTEYRYDGDTALIPTSTKIYHLFENDLLIEDSIFFNNVYACSDTYSYNDVGLLTEKKVVNGIGKYTYIYNSQDTLMQSHYFLQKNKPGDYYLVHSWEYNTQGRLAQETVYNQKKRDNITRIYQYDEDGRLVKVYYYDRRNGDATHELFYDERGFLIKVVTEKWEQKITEIRSISYLN